MAKLDLICRKRNLQSGQRVLNIGCGWGSLMRFAAEHYVVSCVGLTVSEAQQQLGSERCQGLPVEFRLQDYRDIDEPFDHVVSVGMFEMWITITIIPLWRLCSVASIQMGFVCCIPLVRSTLMPRPNLGLTTFFSEWRFTLVGANHPGR